MTSHTMQLIICTFDSTKAEEARTAVQSLDTRLEHFTPGNVAVVERTPAGEIRIQESEASQPGIERAAGTVAERVTEFLFAFAGLLGSDPAPAEMAGYYEGSQVRNRTESALHRLVHDVGFPDAALRQVGQQLQVGQSALILLVQAADEAAVVAELENLGGKIMQHAVAPEIAAQLTR